MSGLHEDTGFVSHLPMRQRTFDLQGLQTSTPQLPDLSTKDRQVAQLGRREDHREDSGAMPVLQTRLRGKVEICFIFVKSFKRLEYRRLDSYRIGQCSKGRRIICSKFICSKTGFSS